MYLGPLSSFHPPRPVVMELSGGKCELFTPACFSWTPALQGAGLGYRRLPLQAPAVAIASLFCAPSLLRNLKGWGLTVEVLTRRGVGGQKGDGKPGGKKRAKAEERVAGFALKSAGFVVAQFKGRKVDKIGLQDFYPPHC